jgi:anti-sigma factor RsiW
MDGELDLIKSLEVEHHLEDCLKCLRSYRTQMALRAAVKDGPLYYRSPAALRKRVLSSLRHAGQSSRASGVIPWRWLGVAASFVAVVILTSGMTRALLTPSSDDLLSQEVIASHVRSQITNHQVDVVSSDQHTVKPWFNGKVDFSPPVEDLTNQGFPLVGGRLDYLDNRPVAALVYRHKQHLINLFIWPSVESPDLNTKSEMRQGYNLTRWTKSGMTYWAISDLNQTEFQEFVQLVQSQTSQTVLPQPSAAEP